MRELKIEWDNRGVSFLGLTTESNIYALFGVAGTASDTLKFSSNVQLVGMYGQYGRQSSISNIGAIIYRSDCGAKALEPIVLEEAEEPPEELEKTNDQWILTDPSEIES